MLAKIVADSTFLHRVCFSDETAFHVSGRVNRNNCRIWKSTNLYIVHEHEWDVWCGIIEDEIIGPPPLFFHSAEITVTEITYLDMPQEYAVPQIPEGRNRQKRGGLPPHQANDIHTFLDDHFTAR